VLAITGGTGKWARAQGEMRLHARNAKGTAYNFTFSVR
jgi:allene oxide cyclase